MNALVHHLAVHEASVLRRAQNQLV